jgi:HTH-type transcriptional regulator / antitoxin HigA
MDGTMDFQPNWASMPGNTITEVLIEKKLTVQSFASAMKTTPDYIQNLIHGNVKITNDIASALSKNLGASPDFWIKREEHYRFNLSRIKTEEADEWLKELPLKDMVKLGWIKDVKDKLSACLDFFNVPDIKTWRTEYADLSTEFSFRTSTTFKSDQASIATWLRRGEIVASEMNCSNWNEDLFETNLSKIRALTRKKNPKDFLPELKKYCAECGVAVVIVPTPSGCRASGATKFITSNQALLLLSFRYLSDDHFWFTFFHEAGHLVLHKSKGTFIEASQVEGNITDEEKEANLFAGEMLIPYNHHSELATLKGNKRNIIGFASKIGVSPGIVVGQMQHQGLIDHKYLNSYKRRFDWDDIL